jgi:hypothetical protein
MQDFSWNGPREAAFCVSSVLPRKPPHMRLFSCPVCSSRLYFENAVCLSCKSIVAYKPFERAFGGVGSEVRQCANAFECNCNWAPHDDHELCAACRLNRTTPDMSVDGNQSRWGKIEAAKRRALYTLIEFGLDIGPKVMVGDENGIAFDFLGDPIGPGPGGERILTGHDEGLITLNISEADAPVREKMREQMGEPYRTLLGHFRHELGHYYWDRLVRDDPQWLERFRLLFGDETADYEQALKVHYENGPPAGWQETTISAYAASHAWEDWAESWAHYLHIVDTLEMVAALDLPLGRLHTQASGDLPPNETGFADEPAEHADAPILRLPSEFEHLLDRWLALSEASNMINRCMGLPDLYPFVITDQVAEKLRFVHELVGAKGQVGGGSTV